MQTQQSSTHDAELDSLEQNTGSEIQDSTSLDRKQLGPWWRGVLYVVATCMALFHVYALAIAPVDAWMMGLSHLMFVLIIGYIYYAARPQSRATVTVADMVIMVLACATFAYALYDYDNLIHRLGVVPEGYDMVVALFMIFAVLELTRRAVGWPLTILVLLALSYCFLGPYLPGMLWHKGYKLERVSTFMMSSNGIFNVPLGTAARYVYIFILFGAFLSISGTTGFFINVANVIAGRSNGGPAKVAVISSGLLGMVNGTSAGNVVTTGSLTIPLMRKTGYSPEFAGAVEACASTGGQIMPPVMGAAVFLMAQIMERPYAEIMVAGIIPALLFYAALLICVDLEARRLGLAVLDKSQLPRWRQIAPQMYLSLPLFVLLGYIILGYSVVYAGLVSLAASVIICIIYVWKEHGMLPRPVVFLRALRSGGINIVQVSITCAAAGMIMGVLTLTGLGMKIATIIIDFSFGNLTLALFLTMVVTIILGMGLPTVAAYVIPATVVVPALVDMGVPELSAHFFVLYFASLSAITPPVALASYAAAAIAEVGPLKVSVWALKLGLSGFIIPYMFVYGPPLLLLGPGSSIALASCTALLGIAFLSVAVVGYLGRALPSGSRWLYALSGLLLIKPGLWTDAVGIGLGLTLAVWQYRQHWQKQAKAETGRTSLQANEE